MRVRYIGNIEYEFHIPGISGTWIKNVWREVSENEYELIKNNKDFETEDKKKKIKEEV